MVRHPGLGELVARHVCERGEENSIRIEYRAPDPACNPYLAFSVMLAAGRKGIEEQYQAPAPVVGDVQEMSPQRRQSLGIRTLPSSLGEAINLAETSGCCTMRGRALESMSRHDFADRLDAASNVTDEA